MGNATVTETGWDSLPTILQRMHFFVLGLTYVTIEPTYLYAQEVSLLWTMILGIFICGASAAPLIVGDERSLILPPWYPYDEYVREN